MLHPATATPAPPSPAPASAPGSDPAAQAKRHPGFDRYLKWARTYRKIPGITSSGWSGAQPDAIQLFSRGAGWTRLFDNVFEDTIEGSKLVVKTLDDGSGGTPPDGYAPFWERTDFMAEAVAALPGVLDWENRRDANGNLYLEFQVADDATLLRLDRMVRETLGDAPVDWQVWRKPHGNQAAPVPSLGSADAPGCSPTGTIEAPARA